MGLQTALASDAEKKIKINVNTEKIHPYPANVEYRVSSY
jgi:hypothetical protein